WLFNSGTNIYTIYFDNSTETFNFATRSTSGSWTTSTISVGETRTGTNFLPSYYALPDTASYDPAHNLFTLFYLNGTSQRIDQWTGSGTVWTKNTSIIATLPAPYPDSLTSFIQNTPSFIGQLYYITGTTRFTINSVRLSLSPASNIASFTTTITAGLGFSATVTLSSAISPTSGLAAACTPSTIPGGSGTSTCSLTASSPGNYNVTVTGTSGSLVHSTLVTVRVLTFPDFTITFSTPPPVDAGQSSSTTMTLSAISGFSGTVTLSDSVPSGLSCTPINPASVSLPPTSTATLSCAAPTANNYNVTITGTSGTLSHSTIVTFKFQDFTITASTPALG
ncbi:MAG TPA: hypothetical protein VFV92_04365, partial [Candidatus Bathyarchaeia archaeon]|nr:hypothetical protein [Candidatus Bathyarchaeia archaeon]